LKGARIQHLLALLLLALTWGSSFILMKKALRDESGAAVLLPAQVAGLRMGIAALVLLPVSLKFFRKLSISDWKYLSVVGLVGSGMPAVLFTTSQQYLDSGIAGILNALTPLFTLLIGLLVFRRVVMPRQFMGVLIGLGGAISLISLRGFGDSANWAYSLLIVLATLFYGISVNTIAAKLRHIRPLHITAISLLIAAVPWGIYLSTSNVSELVSTNPHGTESMLAVIVLAVMGTCVANMLYFWLTQQTSPLFASSVTYLMPLVAIGWGLADNEIVSLPHILCALIILTGVWLTSSK
jgi:drug/metabolite transporter (DMT)-like permease